MKARLVGVALSILATDAFGWYDTEAGRWLSRDPIEEEGGANLYVALDNGPVCFVDPLGERITMTSRVDEKGKLTVEIAATIQVLGCPPPESDEKDELKRDLVEVWTDDAKGPLPVRRADRGIVIETREAAVVLRRENLYIVYVEDLANTAALDPTRHTFRLVDKRSGYDPSRFGMMDSHAAIGGMEAEITGIP